MITDSITDHNNQSYVSGDTLSISGVYENYLKPSDGYLKVIISTTSVYASVIRSTAMLGTIGTLGTGNNYGHPFHG